MEILGEYVIGMSGAKLSVDELWESNILVAYLFVAKTSNSKRTTHVMGKLLNLLNVYCSRTNSRVALISVSLSGKHELFKEFEDFCVLGKNSGLSSTATSFVKQQNDVAMDICYCTSKMDSNDNYNTNRVQCNFSLCRHETDSVSASATTSTTSTSTGSATEVNTNSTSSATKCNCCSQFDCEINKNLTVATVPFSEMKLKKKLKKRFKITEVPSFVMINTKDRSIMVDNGFKTIDDNAVGEGFPWTYPSLRELFHGEFIEKDGHVCNRDAVNNKVIVLYFGALWCSPKREVNTALRQTYSYLKEQHQNIEVIYISSDRRQQEFDEIREEMPWLTLPYGDKRAEHFRRHCSITAIPSLVVLDENYEVINTQALSDIKNDPKGLHFPWSTKALRELDALTADLLEVTPCLLYFTDGDFDEVEYAQKILSGIAEEYQNEYKQKLHTEQYMPELLFLYEGTEETSSLADMIRRYASLPDQPVLLVLLDVTEQQAYVHHTHQGTVTAQELARIVQQYKDDTLKYNYPLPPEHQGLSC